MTTAAVTRRPFWCLFAARDLLVGLIVFGEVVRHRRSALQQRATADSHINNNAVKEIPKLTRRSGFNGTAVPLYFLNQSPGLNDNPTPLSPPRRQMRRIRPASPIVVSAGDQQAAPPGRRSGPRSRRRPYPSMPPAKISCWWGGDGVTIRADGLRDTPGARFRTGGDGASDRWLGRPHRFSPRGVMLVPLGRHRTSPEYRRR